MVLNASAPTTKQDLTDAVGVLISLKLQTKATSRPNSLDAPSG